MVSDMQTMRNDIYATFPNVKDERDKPRLASEKQHYLGEALMAKLVKLYPHYIFELRNENPAGLRIDVLCKEEHLGRMYFHYSWYPDEEVWLSNKRIRGKMSRASHIKTTKLDRSVKEFKKYFKPLSLREHIVVLRKVVKQQINIEMTTITSNLSGHLGVAKLFNQYSTHTAERYAALLEAEGVDEETVLYAKNWLEKLRTVGPIYRTLPKRGSPPRKAVLFYITPDKDYCQVKGWSKEPDLLILREHEVLPKYKTAIGILKMLDDKTYVSNIGYKVNANTFYILDIGDTDESFRC
jgi:hypothetical protein